MAFYVGQKVVCINNKSVQGLLRLNVEYIIERGNYTDPVIEGIYVQLVGVADDQKSPLIDGGGFFASRFRPLVSRPTSISIFTAMLGPRQKETVDG